MLPMHDDEVGPIKSVPATVGRWALATFFALFLMNLLDYMDRWILAAVIQDVQGEFQIDNTHSGLFNTYFLISYSIFSPFMGWAGDRFRRTHLLGLGVGVWSLATVGTGLAQSYNEIVLARSLLGIGEATYGVIAPTILMDLFSRDSRARVMSAFYLAMPIGGALGMSLGSLIAKHYGWRMAFFVVGGPGVLASIAAFLMPEPVRGTSEGVDPERLRRTRRPARPARTIST